MTDAEFVALLRDTVERWWKTRPTPGKRFREILIFLRDTGARPSEAAKLRWSHLDTEQCVIVLTESKTSRTQKFKKPRIIARHLAAIRLLARRRGEGRVCLRQSSTDSLEQKLACTSDQASTSEVDPSHWTKKARS